MCFNFLYFHHFKLNAWLFKFRCHTKAKKHDLADNGPLALNLSDEYVYEYEYEYVYGYVCIYIIYIYIYIYYMHM